jgi:hypothetical protein
MAVHILNEKMFLFSIRENRRRWSSSKQHIKLFPETMIRKKKKVEKKKKRKKIQATYFVKRETRRNCRKRGGLG